MSLRDLPCAAINQKNEELDKAKPRGEGFICPAQMLAYDAAVIVALRSDDRISVLVHDYFTLVRLRAD